MNGNTNEETTAPLDMKLKAMHWLFMNGLGAVVLSVWVWTLHVSNQKQQERMDIFISVSQAQNKELITVLTEIKQYMEEAKYNNRIQTIRNK